MAEYATLLSNSAEEYKKLLGQYQQRVTDLTAQTDVLGRNQLQQAGDYWQKQAGQTNQDMYGRGLANSTIRGSAMQGVARQRAQDFNQINNNINQQKLAVQQQASGDYLSAYERSLQALAQQKQFDQNLAFNYAGLNRPQYGGGLGGSSASYAPGGQGFSGQSLGEMSSNFSAGLANWADLNNPGGYGLSLYPGGDRAYAATVGSFTKPYEPISPYLMGGGFGVQGELSQQGGSYGFEW